MSKQTRSQLRSTDLPDDATAKRWEDLFPGSAKQILAQWEENVRHERRMGIRRLQCAMGIMMLTIAATIVLALFDKMVPSIFMSSGGTIGVATTLITGRSPAVSRRKPA